MCGIVGLFLKNTKFEPELGTLTAGMLEKMSDRGPDSAGFAIYRAGTPGTIKLTLRGAANSDFEAMAASLAAWLDTTVPLSRHDDHAVISVPVKREADVRVWLAAHEPSVVVVAFGARMEMYKAVGLPATVTARFGLPDMTGTHAIGHTRMATESAVTTAGAHPFSTGADQCLVHNGSLSNHNDVRRRLQRAAMTFETQNDTEVAAGYLSWRMKQGDKLDAALYSALGALDGFYTFVVGTYKGFGVLRDPVACKPAVMAETTDYVAFGTEYRAMSDLPGIDHARIFEPEPAKVYFWDRAA